MKWSRTAICVIIRGQGQELDPEESSEIEISANPPNLRRGIKLPWPLPWSRDAMCFDFWMERILEVMSP